MGDLAASLGGCYSSNNVFQGERFAGDGNDRNRHVLARRRA